MVLVDFGVEAVIFLGFVIGVCVAVRMIYSSKNPPPSLDDTIKKLENELASYDKEE